MIFVATKQNKKQRKIQLRFTHQTISMEEVVLVASKKANEKKKSIPIPWH